VKHFNAAINFKNEKKIGDSAGFG